jgi:UTP--glucose-1-phosphate uridylyltransferase
MRALTRGGPKELLRVGGLALIEWVARECAASGIGDVLVVVAPGKESIARLLAPHAGSPGYPVRIDFVIQPTPRGLADAIRFGRAMVGDQPIAVALPDNLFLGDAPGLAQVIETYYRTGKSVVAVAHVNARSAHRYGPTGVFAGRPRGDQFDIDAVPDKTSATATFDAGGAAAAYTGVGRYVLTSDVWALIDEIERAVPEGTEMDDIPVLQRLLAAGRLAGCRIRGDFLDVGLPAGYTDALARLEVAPGPEARGAAGGVGPST